MFFRFLMRKILIISVCILLLFLISCNNAPTQTQNAPIQTQEKETDVIETLSMSCNGPAGESFYLFDGAESFDIIRTQKLSCKKPVEILERKCIQNLGSYEGDTYEMDKVKQGGLIGWAQRKDLTCKNMYCDVAPDSICK